MPHSLEQSLVEFAQELQCAICRGVFVNPTSLPCTHCLCLECSQQVSCCPTCRAPFLPHTSKPHDQIRQIVALYLSVCDGIAPERAWGSQLPTLSQLQPPVLSTTVAVAPALATPAKDPLRVGATVTVARRKSPGINKAGGVGKITKRNEDDGTFDVSYTVEGTKEKRVKVEFITPGLDLESDSLFGSGSTPLPPKQKPQQSKGMCVLLSGSFSMAQKRQYRATAGTLHGEVAETGVDWDLVTHLVIEVNDCQLATRRSEKYLRAISLGGVWIVHSGWLVECAKRQRWVKEDEFEIRTDVVSLGLGLPAGAPSRSRADLLRTLFAGKLFMFVGQDGEQRGLDLPTLVLQCGGKVFSEGRGKGFAQTAKANGQIPILVSEGGEKDSVPASWVVDCIASYTVL
ncbi:hypothetical protein BASA81_001065 [Batrachochytrium salamandrivorans]|nr:hypothetical protein BASA81_001065 [Batrachochytrium salamandrivorans]